MAFGYWPGPCAACGHTRGAHGTYGFLCRDEDPVGRDCICPFYVDPDDDERSA